MPEFGFTYSSLYTQTLALLSAIANNILLFLPVSFHVWTFEALVGRKQLLGSSAPDSVWSGLPSIDYKQASRKRDGMALCAGNLASPSPKWRVRLRPGRPLCLSLYVPP